MNKKTLTWLLKFVGAHPASDQVRFRPGEAVVTDGHRLVRLNWVPFGDDPSVRVPAGNTCNHHGRRTGPTKWPLSRRSVWHV